MSPALKVQLLFGLLSHPVSGYQIGKNPSVMPIVSVLPDCLVLHQSTSEDDTDRLDAVAAIASTLQTPHYFSYCSDCNSLCAFFITLTNRNTANNMDAASQNGFTQNTPSSPNALWNR